jgi:hypothetical protein
VYLFAFFHVVPDTALLKATYNKHMIVLHPSSYVRKTAGLMFHGDDLSLLPSNVLAKPTLGVGYLVGKHCNLFLV